VATATSGNLVINVTAYCKSIDFTNYTGRLSEGARLHVYGSSKFVSSMTNSGSWGFEYNGSPVGATIETGGVISWAPIINGTGDWTLVDDMIVGGGGNLTVTSGNLDLSNRTISGWLGSFVSTGTSTRSTNFTNTTIILGVGNWSVNDSSNLTLTGSTIHLEGYNHRFTGYGLSYNNVIFGGNLSGAVGNCIITISGNNIFENLTLTPRTGYSITTKFTAGTTQTINGDFTAIGTSTNGITITSATTNVHTLSKSAGTVNVEYCTISYSNATGGATWGASNGTNTDSGNNSGWIFNANLMKAYDGTDTITFVGENPATSKLRFGKGGSNYGIKLVATDDADASKFRIYDGSTVKSLKKV